MALHGLKPKKTKKTGKTRARISRGFGLGTIDHVTDKLKASAKRKGKPKKR